MTAVPASAPGSGIDRTSPVPLYFQIAQQLTSAIDGGALPAGSRLESEVELAERIGVSRPTIRQAIDRLIEQGVVVRRRGIGTVVVPQRIRRPLQLSSLYDDLLAAGRRPTTTVMTVTTIPADSVVAHALGLSRGAGVQFLERLRSADGVPLSLMRNYLPAGLVELEPPGLEARGLYAVLRSAGIQPQVAEQTLGARAATPAEARLLDGPRGLTVLTMDRTAFDASGRAIEYGSHCYRADRYTFEMRLVVR